MIPLPLAVESVLEIAGAHSLPVFVVGGVVRDLLLSADCEQFDVDVLVDGPSAALAADVARKLGGEVTVHARFLTAKVTFPNSPSSGTSEAPMISEIDFASARTETYSAPGALPDVVAATLAEDLRRRDFSINAMALPLAEYSRVFLREAEVSDIIHAIVDPFQGNFDLAVRSVRILHPNSFVDDPTRMVRAARYKTRLNGQYEAETRRKLEEAIRSNHLERLSFQRYTRELLTCLDEPDAAGLFRELIDLQLWRDPIVTKEILTQISGRLARLDDEILRRSLTSDRNLLRREMVLAFFSRHLPEKEFKSLPVASVERKRAVQLSRDPKVTFGDVDRENLIRSLL